MRSVAATFKSGGRAITVSVRFGSNRCKKVLHGPITYLKDSGEEDLSPDQMQAVDFIKKMLLADPEKKKKKKT